MAGELGYDFYDALIAHYESEKKEALAVLKLYMTNAVGIADHSSIMDDMKTWTKRLAEAEDGLTVLNKYFVIQDNKQLLK
jgi:hypothetical protein